MFRSATALLLLSTAHAFAQGIAVDGDAVFSPNPRAAFETGTDPIEATSGKSDFIRSLADGSPERQSADFSRWLPADSYRGKRIRISTRLKTAAADRASCTLSAWTDTRMIQTADGAVRSGSGNWEDCSVVMQIPDRATRVKIGFYLRGTGEVWADRFNLEEVGLDVAETHRPVANMDRGSDEGRTNRAINVLNGFGD